MQVRQKHFAIVSYGGTGGAGAVLEGSPPPPIYTCTRQPDTESHPPAPQQPIHSSTRGSISGPRAKPAACIFFRTGTNIKKLKPPQPLLRGPASVQSASPTGSAARVSSRAAQADFSFDVRSRLLPRSLCCQSKHTPAVCANIS